MLNEKRTDFSYDLWKDPVIKTASKEIYTMNEQYGSGECICYITESCIYPSLTKSFTEMKITQKNVQCFQHDAIYIAKIVEGAFIIEGAYKRKIVLEKGCVFCFYGNFSENITHTFTENLLMAGVFCYYDEVLSLFAQKEWDTALVKTFCSAIAAQPAVRLHLDTAAETLFNSLYDAMIEENNFLISIKSLDFFYSVMKQYKKLSYQKTKSYFETQKETVAAVKAFLDTHLDTYYPTAALAERFSISLSRMQDIFKSEYGTTPYRYHLDARLQHARRLIKTTEHTFLSISEQSGFKSYNKFIKAYKAKYECAPSDERRAFHQV